MNLIIEHNLIHQSYVHGVKKLVFLGSSCIYPKMAPQPISEDCLLSGSLEETNEPYAIAKIAGLKCAKAITVSMEAISSQSCPVISLGKTTILI